MKISKEKPEFQPVTIVLESDEEVRAVLVSLWRHSLDGTEVQFRILAGQLHRELRNLS